MRKDLVIVNPEVEEQLNREVASFPNLPGVYLMKDKGGEVLYVGKARDLKARVRTYLIGGDGRAQLKYLMHRVHQLDKIVCATEEQAFILERDLIGRYKPRYNIRLKDDKAYLSVKIDENSPWPRLEFVRRRDDENASYYGPYTWSFELRQVLEVIRNVVPLRTCSDTVLYNRQRPCLEYQLKRCAAPCCLPVEEQDYHDWVKQAKQILEGRIDTIIAMLREKMDRASEELRFEAAAAHRDRIETLERFSEGHKTILNLGESRDAIHFYREGDKAALSILHVRNGRMHESSHFALENVVVTDAELLESVIEQFYAKGREIPGEILLPVEIEDTQLLEKWLREISDYAVHIYVPERGVKARLLGLAEVNARQHFLSKFDLEARYSEAAGKLAVLLHLRQVPRRIECVDISNFQGSDIVGAIVVFFDGEPQKRDYRKYRISQQGKPDDFHSIYEVVHRRLTRAMTTGEFPDLLLIDGGTGQLRMALQARDELGLQLDIASLAKIRETESGGKKPERLFREGEEDPIPLDERDEVTHLVQRIRDEVHRFVITFHRASRGKRVFRSILDDIPGVGPERRQRLMKHYGSIHRMVIARPEDLARAGRMPKPLAEKVIRILKERLANTDVEAGGENNL